MMRKLWIKNTPEDRIAILQQAERTHTGVTLFAVEKDWWVTATLYALSRCACAPYLSFKGGTSLSKGFGLIERFSEDIDIALQHSFFGIEPINRSQRDKLRKVSRAYIHNTLSEQLDDELRQMGVYGYRIENVTQVSAKGGATKPIDSDKDPTTILVYYESVIEEPISYIPQRVKVEISCMSMDEPVEIRSIRSMIADALPVEDESEVSFPTVLPTRTFLEKIFLLAEEFQKDSPRHLRMSRHLYDIERLMDCAYGVEALSDRRLYDAIVEHRRLQYALRYVDYELLSPSRITIVAPQKVLHDWTSDYKNMREHFIYGASLPFDQLLCRIEELQTRIRDLGRN